MATHSSILAWEISWTEVPVGLKSMGLQKSWIQFSNEGTNNRGKTHRLLIAWDIISA